VKTLVTGSSGFVGREVVKLLRWQGDEVIEYDISHGENILDKSLLMQAIVDQNIGAIIHLAGTAHLEQCAAFPDKAVETNIMGTINLIELCCRSGNKAKLIYISSSYVNSREGGIYRITKQTCEELIKEYHKNYGLRYTIVRCGSIYGAGADENNYLYQIIKGVLESDRVFVCEETGQETREYIHVSDVARGIDDSLRHFQNENETVLLSGLHPYSTDDIISLINEITGKNVDVKYNNQRRKNHYTFTPYALKENPCTKLVFDKYVDLGAGLLEMIEEVKNELGNSRT